MQHEELQELLGAYALDALDGAERDAVDAHLRECATCRAEVADHREVAALLAQSGAPAPDHVWDRIVASMEPSPPRLRVEIDESGVGTVVPFAARRNRNVTRFLGIVAAAAVVAVVALTGTLLRQGNRIGSLEAQVQASSLNRVAMSARSSASARTVELRSKDGRTRAPVTLTAEGVGYLSARGMPRLRPDRTYQLWGVIGTRVISLGTFPGGSDVVPFRVDPKVDSLAVTEEVAGGVPQSTRDPVVAGAV
ncbi:MAG: anti-sigma factor [Actinobacteria bacterium]|nr:anti-sigma factor [Actinomycetota bacterium]